MCGASCVAWKYEDTREDVIGPHMTDVIGVIGDLALTLDSGPAFTMPPMALGPVTISAHLSIPDAELVERFVRASGAGGQNVNKVSTAVELRFDVAGSPSLPEPLRSRLLARRDRRMTGDGVLVIDAQRFRTQDRNRDDARERLAAFIQESLSVPKPRVATKPSYGAKLRRLDEKKGRAQIKRGRTTRNWE
jgi:ribosome-associated protein